MRGLQLLLGPRRDLLLAVTADARAVLRHASAGAATTADTTADTAADPPCHIQLQPNNGGMR